MFGLLDHKSSQQLAFPEVAVLFISLGSALAAILSVRESYGEAATISNAVALYSSLKVGAILLVLFISPCTL